MQRTKRTQTMIGATVIRDGRATGKNLTVIVMTICRRTRRGRELNIARTANGRLQLHALRG